MAGFQRFTICRQDCCGQVGDVSDISVDREGVVDSIARVERVLLKIVLEELGTDAHLPIFLVDQPDFSIQFLHSEILIRIEPGEKLALKPRGRGQAEEGVDGGEIIFDKFNDQ